MKITRRTCAKFPSIICIPKLISICVAERRREEVGGKGRMFSSSTIRSTKDGFQQVKSADQFTSKKRPRISLELSIKKQCKRSPFDHYFMRFFSHPRGSPSRPVFASIVAHLSGQLTPPSPTQNDGRRKGAQGILQSRTMLLQRCF